MKQGTSHSEEHTSKHEDWKKEVHACLKGYGTMDRQQQENKESTDAEEQAHEDLAETGANRPKETNREESGALDKARCKATYG